jgi:hypothetical protein
VDKNDIGVSTTSGVESLAGPLRDNPYIDPGSTFEQRQDVTEQA